MIKKRNSLQEKNWKNKNNFIPKNFLAPCIEWCLWGKACPCISVIHARRYVKVITIFFTLHKTRILLLVFLTIYNTPFKTLVSIFVKKIIYQCAANKITSIHYMRIWRLISIDGVSSWFSTSISLLLRN